jgi:hypothetical protein
MVQELFLIFLFYYKDSFGKVKLLEMVREELCNSVR